MDAPTPLDLFLAELDRLDGCPHTKRKVRELMRGMVGQKLHLSKRVLEGRERVRAAVVLLDSGVSATKTRADIARRFGVHQRTAERIVAAALNERAERVTGQQAPAAMPRQQRAERQQPHPWTTYGKFRSAPHDRH